jgi:hypothetical protein
MIKAKIIWLYIMFVARDDFSYIKPVAARNWLVKPQIPRNTRSAHSFRFPGRANPMLGIRADRTPLATTTQPAK